MGDIIKSLGLDVKEMEEAAKQPGIMELIKSDVKEIHSFGLDGTPMFVVGGVPVRGAVPLEDFETALELALQKVSILIQMRRSPYHWYGDLFLL